MNRIRKGIFVGTFIAALYLVTGLAVFAQSTSTLQGIVTDSAGAVVPGAQITATQIQTGLSRMSSSDSAGNYAFPSLQPGTYRLVVNAPGMQPTTMENIPLSVDSTETVNVKLGVAAASQTVQVSGVAQQINDSTMNVGQVIGQRTVQQIPLNGRHFVDLGLLIPGSVTAPQNGFLTAPLRGFGAASFDTAGNREDTVNFMINGVNLNDMSQNQITFQPTINTVSEFKVDNSSLSAEYGRNSGAVVNIATRSGTNEFHGEAYDYVRNQFFDARNFFNPAPIQMSPFKRNQPGGDLGGPVWIPHLYDGRNKTFIFGSYEGLIQRQGITINSGVPTAAQRASVTDPTVQKLLAVIPTANDSTGARFIGSATAPVNIKQYTGDLLHTIDTNDQLHLYYAWQQDARDEPTLQGNSISGFGDHRTAHRQIGTIVETHEFSSNVVNEARLGFNRIAISFVPKFTPDPTTFGIDGGVTTAIGLPQISVSSIGLNFGGPSGFPQGRFDTTGVFSDTLSLLRGKSSYKFGGEFRRVISSNFNEDTGTFSFPTTSAFLNDQANSFSVTPGRISNRVYVNSLGLYGEDLYKFSPTFTVELGFRFDWNGTPTEGENRFVVFNPAAVSLVQVGTQGLGKVYNQNYAYNPRVGFIWDVSGKGTTILRAGFSTQADQPIIDLVTPLSSNPPFSNPVFYTSATTPISMTNAYTASKTSGTLAPTTVPHNFSNSYVESYNVNLQQQFPLGLVGQFAYVGSHGVHLRLSLNENQFIDGVRPFTALSPTSAIDPSKGLGNIQEYDSIGTSHYNALWATITRRFTNGLQFNTSYTWTKSTDLNSLSSQGITLQNSYNPANNYGLSDFDVRDRWVFSGIYALPFHRNIFVDGWQTSAIVQIQTGNPITVATTSTFNGTPNTIRPDVSGPVHTTMNILSGGTVQYLPASLCYTATPGCLFSSDGNHFGDLARNSISGPGFQDVDVSLQKDTTFHQRYTFEVRGDAFNLLNHPNFGQPLSEFAIGKGTVSTGNFGRISSTRFPVGDAGSSRQLQLSGKFIF